MAEMVIFGRRSFVEDIKKQMRSLAVGRRIRKGKEGFELRESQASYKPFFDPKKNDIEAENLLYWNK